MDIKCSVAVPDSPQKTKSDIGNNVAFLVKIIQQNL